ncbi:MAG: porphobilinogen synthase [Spirochaetaceae bacterium]|jgi:porphobilinogen synthase|nr:porphobilinogen synthase [Spirochaetaceae bacterium]
MVELLQRARRLRGSETLRRTVRETRISKDALIYPVFVKPGKNIAEEIVPMPGQYRYSVDRLGAVFDRLLQAGVDKILFFGLPEQKDAEGSGAWREDGIVQQALRWTKDAYPEIYCIGDLCMCEYTDHGHCGILDGKTVDNDATLDFLAKIALSQVKAGADMVAPSDMMDGRVIAIRRALDAAGFSSAPIMSYAAKYSSSFYGPFREAADSAPTFGDRKSYQMDYHNAKEAVKEALRDIEEGADIIMVKPALSYLDVIRRCAQVVNVPLAAYSVSGEYAMIKAAGSAGSIDEDAVIAETAASIFRAGADILISYFAAEIGGFVDSGRIG